MSSEPAAPGFDTDASEEKAGDGSEWAVPPMRCQYGDDDEDSDDGEEGP